MSPDSLMSSALHMLPAPSLGRPAAYRGLERRRRPEAAHWLQLALDEVDYGLLLVSHRGRVLHMNHVARLDLADGAHPLLVVGHQLRTRHADDDGALRDALADAAERDLRCMLTVGQAPRRVSLAVVPLAGPQGQDEGASLLMFSKRQVCEALSVEAFARGHGLTGAETQVLKALCSGVTPHEAAQMQGVRLSTVRTQIGSIRAKTGASSIRALVQQVACLPPLVTALRAAGMKEAALADARLTHAHA
ncbi:MAG: helix-turn-helix transcriptional regulator [Aquincola tertiaricarbonis]|uniref:helix-turn-helix transcriptional regulator n=1 Tax=Aquincola sp. J276 TaxID=2898432 RepID=UPI0021513191|nr:helix-turn-helix transcriptional regulator [Aquincola sp. J276]MCR5865917.1 helix-turn-helix transcriptional regulator [Aquincola sp. J276]